MPVTLKNLPKGDSEALAYMRKIDLHTENIVFFVFAPWCPYCKSTWPTFKTSILDIAVENEVVLVPINIDIHKALTMEINDMDAQKVPYIVFYHNGQNVATCEDTSEFLSYVRSTADQPM
jgi:glutaredoxin